MLTFTMLQNFPLGEIFGHYLDLMWHLERVRNGSVIALIVAGTGTVGLRDSVILLRNLGSLFAQHLQPLSHWCWIFIKGGKTLFESTVIGSQNIIKGIASISLSTIPHIPSNLESIDHWKFCQEVDVIGDFCDSFDGARSLDKIESRNQIKSSVLDNVPVIITAGNRLPYLHHTLKTLMKTPGFRKNKVEVFLGDTSNHVIEMLKLLNINYTPITVYGTGNAKLFQYYRSVFSIIVQKYNTATAVIFMDEDVEVAPDFFSFMDQMIPFLLTDDSLFCVNGHGFHIERHFKGLIDLVERIRTPVAWGYALTIDFISNILSRWPRGGDHPFLYDVWMLDEISDGRECISPEVSRAKHFGVGINSDAIDLEERFMPLQLPEPFNIRISNLDEITKESWQEKTLRDLTSAKVIDKNPCYIDINSDLIDGNYVLYYLLETAEDETYSISNYHIIGECLGFWAKSDFGFHDMVTRLRFSPGTLLFIVGVPTSPYTQYLNLNLTTLWDFNSLSELERIKTMKRIFSSRYNTINGIEKKLSQAIFHL